MNTKHIMPQEISDLIKQEYAPRQMPERQMSEATHASERSVRAMKAHATMRKSGSRDINKYLKSNQYIVLDYAQIKKLPINYKKKLADVLKKIDSDDSDLEKTVKGSKLTTDQVRAIVQEDIKKKMSYAQIYADPRLKGYNKASITAYLAHHGGNWKK